MDANDQLALQRARERTAKLGAKQQDRQASEHAAHVTVSQELLRRAVVVAAELAQRGHPAVHEVTYWEKTGICLQKVTAGGWGFFSYGDWGETSSPTTVSLLSDGRIIMAGRPLSLAPGRVFLTPAEANRALAALNSLIR